MHYYCIVCGKDFLSEVKESVCIHCTSPHIINKEENNNGE